MLLETLVNRFVTNQSREPKAGSFGIPRRTLPTLYTDCVTCSKSLDQTRNGAWLDTAYGVVPNLISPKAIVPSSLKWNRPVTKLVVTEERTKLSTATLGSSGRRTIGVTLVTGPFVKANWGKV